MRASQNWGYPLSGGFLGGGVLVLPLVSSILPNWVAVKELNLNYYIGEILLFTICTHYGNLI